MSFAAKEAVVVFDPVRVTVEQMVEAVNRLGFKASLKGAAPSGAPDKGH